jgi:hypothetical protein
MKTQYNYLLIIVFFFHSFSWNTTAQTTVVKKENGWSLLVDGKPFEVKGVTFGYDKDVKKYDTYCKDLQFLGVNTIRI